MNTKAGDGAEVIRVLLIDDHRLVREGIRRLLDTDPRLQVVGEGCDGEELLSLAAKARADVAVVDVAMPVLGGLDALPLLQRAVPDVRVMMLSMHGSGECVHHALANGALGYVLKTASREVLRDAVYAVARGETFLCPAVTRQLLDGYARRGGNGPAAADGAGRLTQRQREVLRLIAEGNTTKGIAQQLGLSVKTVESHRGEISRRLGVNGVAELVVEAIRLGLVIVDCVPGLESLAERHGRR